MNTKPTCFSVIAAIVVFGMWIATSTLWAQSQVVNISGIYDQIDVPTAWNPLAVSLAAGSYTVTPVDPPTPGAIYTAYDFYPGGPWSAGYSIGLQSPQQVSGDTGETAFQGNSVYSFYAALYTFPDPSTAFANALSGSFTITTAQTAYFGVSDSYYGDNSGGVSLQLTFTPILCIQATNNNSVVLSWPAISTGYVLEQNPVPGTTNWVLNTNSVTPVNGTNYVLIDPATNNMFYQLVNP